MTRKTDNHNLPAKLDLRRHFLRLYHADGQARVFDAFQGSGTIWKTLRHEFQIARYWGTDVKPKKGRLRIECLRVLQQQGWTDDVIDLDCYGEPWGEYEAVLLNAQRSITVFLTIAKLTSFGSQMHLIMRRVVGLGKLQIPNSIAGRISLQLQDHCIGMFHRLGYDCQQSLEADTDGSARYIGLRLNYKRN